MLNRKQVIEDFESMTNMAKLKALSAASLDRPLTDDEYKKMMMLKNSLFPMSDNEFSDKIKKD